MPFSQFVIVMREQQISFASLRCDQRLAKRSKRIRSPRVSVGCMLPPFRIDRFVDVVHGIAVSIDQEYNAIGNGSRSAGNHSMLDVQAAKDTVKRL